MPAHKTVPAIAGLLRMFPSNGYMISAEVARKVRYRPPQLVGEACDTDFALRARLSANALWFLDEYVSTYRVSDDAVSKRNYLQPFAYDAIESAGCPAGGRRGSPPGAAGSCLWSSIPASPD